MLIGSDGRILAAGSSREVAVPVGVPTLDASGMTLLPGLIDAHVHLAWDKTPTTYILLRNTKRGCGRGIPSANSFGPGITPNSRSLRA